MAFTGRVEEIWTQHDSVHQTIYKPGQALQRPKIPTGKSWEVHVLTTARWDEVAPWATAVTLMGDITGGNAHLCPLGACNYEFAFNMGNMPSANVNVGRMRFWKNQAYTNVPPPIADR